MDDYHEFRRAHEVEIEAWRAHWSPAYVSIAHSRATSSTAIVHSAAGSSSMSSIDASAGTSTIGATRPIAIPPAFDHMLEFFDILRMSYQDVHIE